MILDFKDRVDQLENLVMPANPDTLVVTELTVSPVLQVLTGVTEQRETWVTLVRTDHKVLPVRRELVVCLDLQENPEDPVWTEEKEKEDAMENLVDLESQVVKEIQEEQAVLESLVVVENLVVMEVKESPAEVVWTVVLVPQG